MLNKLLIRLGIGIMVMVGLGCGVPLGVRAQEEVLEATVLKVVEQKEIDIAGNNQLYQKLQLLVTKGAFKDRTIEVENGTVPATFIQQYQENDRVLVTFNREAEGPAMFTISDSIRRGPQLWLFVIFVVVVVAVGRWQGLLSMAGMGFSFLVIFFIILPRILAGANPVQVVILGSALIIPITFFLSHGINRKTWVGIMGTLAALIISGILATIFVSATKLTGYASEEANFLQFAQQGKMNLQGLVLAGIIIGLLGVLDDITISQSAVVFQLKETDPSLSTKALFAKAMKVGQDHISSMVNTLVLVYTGSAFPLLLLFINNPRPFGEVINYELIAEEIVRTLVGSIGLVLAVPITSLIAAFVANSHKSR